MKRVLGLDLGVASIGWALVNEKEKDIEESSIVKLGVRAIQYDTFGKSDGTESNDPKKDFAKGKGLSPNASRTKYRGARRRLQRYKLRRDYLKKLLIKNGFITSESPLTEIGKDTTHETLRLRSKAADSKVELEQIARVLLTINKKRGYKSNRNTVLGDEGQSIDNFNIAKKLYDNQMTPGEYVLELLPQGKTHLPTIPEFYRSDLKEEFRLIWEKQREFYPGILTDKLFDELQGKNKSQTWAICKEPFQIVGIKDSGNSVDKKRLLYQRRVKGINERLELEELAITLQEINNDINKSSHYLGSISDRSKQLYINNLTVGQFLFDEFKKNPHYSKKNKIFYRQDYLDEFEKIWERQKVYYPSLLTKQLKEEIRDCVIFYQRRLKSMKGLLNLCQFENWQKEIVDSNTGEIKTRTVGHKVIPKSSPLFQEFRVWQNLNNLEFKNSESQQNIKFKCIEKDLKERVFNELNIKSKLKPSDVLKILKNHMEIGNVSDWKCNFKEIEGNRTNEQFFNVYHEILLDDGQGLDWNRLSASEKISRLELCFSKIGISADVLKFDSSIQQLDKQANYKIWHLLYSADEPFTVCDEDKIEYGTSNVNIRKILYQRYGFPIEFAKELSNITFSKDYGSLSARAIRKILPFLKEGYTYPEACELAGYNHSNSLTKKDLENKTVKSRLDLLPKNSLRNPVVEKILNQMVNVVNQIIDTYGKPDEIRIELARELKKSADERKKMTDGIEASTKKNNEIRNKIIKVSNIQNPTRNDIIRYKLWEELETRGYKDIFRNKQIKHEDLFSSYIEIEHIIPKSLLFNDSFSNKTLAFSSDNKDKGDRTAFDFISQDYGNDLDDYKSRVESLFKNEKISKAKRNNLLMSQNEIPNDFIERDLRNSQYIAKKAKDMLQELIRENVVVTSGKITDELRKDWGIINVIKELNLPRYEALERTKLLERKNGQTIKVIENWSKREDHRHHAMDALTVAYTTHNHIQYLNNLHARKDNASDKKANIIAIEKRIKERTENGQKRFKSPIGNMRLAAKKHIESILVSFNSQNKVMTQNINQISLGGSKKINKTQLTPRGQLHKETVYGKIKIRNPKPIKLSKRFGVNEAYLICNRKIREVIHTRLKKYDLNPELAFSTQNLKTDPLLFNNKPLKEVFCFEEIYTINKQISPNIKVEKVIDQKIKKLLEERIESYNGDKKSALSDLDKNPIWLNESKGIKVKSVRIKGVSETVSLRTSKNHLGRRITTQNNQFETVDFVSTGNNHNVAIYKDKKGLFQEKVTPFFEAVNRVNLGLKPIDYTYMSERGWEFQFTLKKNEMFVFPSRKDNFDPNQIDLTDIKNYSLISRHLFRVQKIAKRNYVFRHHLETSVNTNLDFTYRLIQTPNKLNRIVKVRIDHIGNIVNIGEY
ncbi:MAG: type II CRISPR RNA-guided endonuclease Cas9 [Flavobacteriaceae bacterium]|nr:type II CRISPR RNA-guided endonuclease Cas9 [Flavobacteriaceae bacterium]MCY4266928.1 type II CRISPR RNA-guided endonuclease Cas9 [Flavobacteriaceae bacterium]